MDASAIKLVTAQLQTRVLDRRQYDSILRLLTIFAQHLSSLSNQLMVAAREGAERS